MAHKMQPRQAHRGRYEVFSDVVGKLEGVLGELHQIDLRKCPPETKGDHKATRQAVTDAIKHAKRVCEIELDVLNGRSEGQ